MILTSHRADDSAGCLAPGAHEWASHAWGSSDLLPVVDWDSQGRKEGRWDISGEGCVRVVCGSVMLPDQRLMLCSGSHVAWGVQGSVIWRWGRRLGKRAADPQRALSQLLAE